MEPENLPTIFIRQIGLLILILIFVVAGVLIIGLLSADEISVKEFNDQNIKSRINANNIELNLVVASTTEALNRGLGGRDRLLEGTGMLFIFGRSGYHGIWMKDMKFAIDILWINDQGQIVDLKKEILPETYPEVFLPKEISSFVIELPAGFSDKHDIKIGDSIEIPEI